MTMFDDIADLLADEQASLLSGDYGALDNIALRKQALSERMMSNADRLTDAELRRILDLSSRNEELLLATQKGLRAARAQIGDTTGNAHTYSCDGERANLTFSPRIEKKI